MAVIASHQYMTFRAFAIAMTRVWTGRIKNRGLVGLVMAKVLNLDEVDLDGRTVLVRVDINSPLDPCLLYTSPSPRDRSLSRMPSSA